MVDEALDSGGGGEDGDEGGNGSGGAFEFTIGGKPIVYDMDGVVQSWLDTYQPLRFLRSFLPHSMAGAGNRSGNYLDIGLSLDNWSQIPELRINELYWPTGASRFAFGIFLMRRQDVESWDMQELEKAVPVKFKASGTLETEMYPAWKRTNQSSNEQNDLLLVFLVDERFWWQGKTAGDLSFADPPTWSDLFSQLGQELAGESIDTSEIHEDYLAPDKQELERKYGSATLMLDAAAHSVGQRIIRLQDGTTKSVGWQAAWDELYGQLGQQEGTPSVIAGGGTVVDRAFPEKVEVIFQGLVNHIPCPHPYKAEVEPPEENDIRANIKAAPGTVKTIYCTAYADYTTNGVGGEPDNKEKLESLAAKIAESFYLGITFPYLSTTQGISPLDTMMVPWTDHVIYRIGVEVPNAFENVGRICTTQVVSLPYNGHPETNLCQDSDIKVLTAKNYVGHTSGGITARSSTTPGAGTVRVYQKDENTGNLAATDITDLEVLNWSETAVDSGKYVKVSVDEWCTVWLDNAECGS